MGAAGFAFGRAELAVERQIVIGAVEFHALADAARRSKPRLHPTRAAAHAISRAPRDRVDAGKAIRRIRTVWPRGASFGGDVEQRALQVGAATIVTPAQQ